MHNFDTDYLKNGIKVITRKNPNTPRIELDMFLDAGIKYENKAGISSLSARLLLQGTEKRSAEQLAEELDFNAIELNVEGKQDYTKVKSLFLNEDLETALDIFADILKNSTFAEFEKEVRKFKGEIEVDLDSPKTKAVDNLIKNMYPEHPYGGSHTRILDKLHEITKEDVKNYHLSSLKPEKIIIVAVGDFEKESLLALLEKYFGDISSSQCFKVELETPFIKEKQVVTIEKNDAAQAQVIQGWIVPGILNEDYPALTILNTILGSSGLSSRLFVELRDKQGLAYVVRSSYEALKLAGNFSVYIATEPKNIKVALEGFKTEIGKLQNELVDEKELEDAKNNILGKRAFFHETNSQQANYLGHFEILGLGADYDEKIADIIRNVTAEDVKNVAVKYLSDASVVSLLAPEEYLKKV